MDVESYFEKHGKLVYNFLYSKTYDSELAEELTQETFYQAIKSINRFKGNCKPSTWLCQIAKHILYNYIKKNKKSEELLIENTQYYSINFEEKFFEKQNKINLYKLIQQLDNETKDVIHLRLTNELSFGEIGEIMGKSENWARVKFYRGKEKLIRGGKEI